MKLWNYHQLMKAFRDLIINIGAAGCDCKSKLPWTVEEGQEELIPQIHMATYTLKSPVKPGFRRPLTLTPDESLDKMANGQYASVEVLQGDSTVNVDPESTDKSVKVWVYGDGALGDKVARVKADGHIGEGDAEITQDIAWTVTHPDATVFGSVTEGPDEAIPVA